MFVVLLCTVRTKSYSAHTICVYVFMQFECVCNVYSKVTLVGCFLVKQALKNAASVSTARFSSTDGVFCLIAFLDSCLLLLLLPSPLPFLSLDSCPLLLLPPSPLPFLGPPPAVKKISSFLM